MNGLTSKFLTLGLVLFLGATYAVASPRPPFAKVISSRLEETKNGMGLWRGTVLGQGKISLNLKIFKGNKILSTSTLGRIILRENSSTFAFWAPIPSQPGVTSGWDWRLEAKAT